MNPNIFRDLRNVLAELYPDEMSIRRITSDSGIRSSQIRFDSNAINIWDSVLKTADNVNRVDALLDIVYEEFKENDQFTSAHRAYYQSISQQLKKQPSVYDRRTIDYLFLPWMVNRDEQLYRLSEAVKQAKETIKYPIVCLIYGDDDECHDKFVERLEIHSLVKLLSVDPQTPVRRIYLNWPKTDHFRNTRELQQRLLARLASEVLNDNTADERKINDSLASLSVPVLVDTTLLIEDSHHQVSEHIEGFLEFWERWPTLKDDQWLIACLCIRAIKYPQNIWKFWHMRRLNYLSNLVTQTLHEISLTKFNRIIGVKLPKLEPITKQEIANWAFSHEIRNHCHGKDLVAEITTIFEKREFSSLSTGIPMRLLYYELQSILSKHRIEEKSL